MLNSWRKLVVAAAALALAGCGSATAAKTDLTDYYSQSAQWGSCAEKWLIVPDDRSSWFDPKNAKCASVKVPASYAGDAKDELSIGVIKIPATGTRIGSLFFNPGGPGESGIDFVQWLELSKELRASYDIIGFDPRGVGVSSPVRCSDDLDKRSYYEMHTAPKNEAEALADDAFMQRYFEQCRDANPNWHYLTSENVVRDMDILREVVAPGESLNFVGASYGTTLASEYIRLFPKQVGRIVLDSPTKNDGEQYADAITNSKASYEAMLRLFDKCAEDTQCPGDTRDEVEKLIFAARDKADAGKLWGVFGTKFGTGDHKDYTLASAYLIHEGIVALTYWPLEDAYPEFRDAMVEMVDNDDYAYFEWYGLSLDGYQLPEGTRNNSFEIMNIVNCLDVDGRDLHSVAEQEAQRKAIAQANPFSHEFFSASNGYEWVDPTPGCEWSYFAAEDPQIPDPPASMPTPENKSGKQFLVIGSTGDNATPFEFAQQMAKNLDSPLITYQGTGHANGFNGIKCIDDAIYAYLLDGTLPENGLTCPAV